MLVFYIEMEFEIFYFCGRTSKGEPILSVDIDDSMHFNEVGYDFLLSMHELGYQVMWGV